MLAQSQLNDTVYQAILWLALVMLAVLLLGMVVVVLRRRLLGPTKPKGLVLDLERLRELRDRGELTVPEYEALRKEVLGVSSKPSEKPPPAPERD